MALPWRILAEHWESGWFGYVVELPGCRFFAPALDSLLQRAPVAIAAHLAWLRRHSIPVSERPADRLVLAESAEALPGGIGPLFEADRAHLSPDELELGLRTGDAAMEELLELAERSRDQLELPHSGQPSGWTPPEILRHVADRDLWYAARLMPDVGALTLSADPYVRVQSAHRAFTSGIRAWWALWKNRVVDRDGERWTVAKVVRRRTAHLLEHLEQLAQWTRDTVRPGDGSPPGTR